LRHDQSRTIVLVAALVVALLATGCTSLGPNKLQDSHVSYNKAVQKAIMEEDLLNVVRLRYLDMPVSLSVSSIAAQTTFTVGSRGEFGLVEEEWSANILPNISYSDRPTITFTPAQGQQFLESLAQPIPLETLVRLAATHSGIDVLLRVAVASLNGILNRFDTASPEFDRLAADLRALEIQNAASAGFLDRSVALSEPIPADSVDADALLQAARDGRSFERQADGSYRLMGPQSVPFVWVDPSDPATRQVVERLHLQADLASYEIKHAHQIEPPENPSDTLAVSTRSLLQVAVYLSHGVEVPEAHGSLGVSRFEGGQAPELSDLFTVRVSSTRPEEPGIAVQYRDHWFLIPDSDHVSKRTFGLMQALFLSLTLKESGQGAPVLTLPLN
jgi:hypothetical protein